VLSLPILAAASWAAFAIFFAGAMPAGAFAIVIVAETLLGRPNELVMIVNNGMGKFGRAATLAIISSAIRAVAAVIFVAMPAGGLTGWTWLYLAANATSLIIAVLFYYPRQPLSLKTGIYFKRLPDALYVAGAEVLFYLQMELDKLLVLAIGGAQLAGIYAIIMRLVDLTAIPIRAFTMMLVQKMMRAPEMRARLAVRAGIEGSIFAVSTLALLCLTIILHFFPGMLGRNVAEAAPLIGLAIMVPGLRNLVYTAPYFHNGQVHTIGEAVRIMASTQLNQPVTDAQVADIVSFLETLTGPFPAQEMPRLPPTPGDLID
jgi:O-antigen/teichoic acid export membrane protein